jgi:hypothetical protein
MIYLCEEGGHYVGPFRSRKDAGWFIFERFQFGVKFRVAQRGKSCPPESHKTGDRSRR